MARYKENAARTRGRPEPILGNEIHLGPWEKVGEEEKLKEKSFTEDAGLKE